LRLRVLLEQAGPPPQALPVTAAGRLGGGVEAAVPVRESALELVLELRESGADRPQRQLRPPGEVPLPRRSVAGEVAPGQLGGGRGLLAVEGALEVAADGEPAPRQHH